MCGIAAFLSRTDQQVDRAALERMVAAVAHRGPDGEGLFVEGRVGFGHRRLAIIDLSAAGAQPMHCAASGRVIIYNGEIYNYLELRAELQAGGYRFHTESDTEVILAAYDRWGAECVQRFNGMWAFALLDQRQHLVFCSRDRFGVKPFYYVDDPRFFAIGSELRQLLPLLESRKASREVLLNFLSFGVDEQGTETFFAGVRRLAPGHNLFYSVTNGSYSIERYYSVPEQDAPRRMSGPEASVALRELLTDAVRLRLRSDVRVGTCLSGGLDSSSIAAIAVSLTRDAHGPRFASITAASESATNDESAYAKIVVDHAELDWHRILPDFEAFAGTLREVVRAQEEPFRSPSVCMQFLVMQEAKRRRIPVLLDGQGGDETLLGYERYVTFAIRELYGNSGLGSALRFMRNVAKNNEKLKLGSQLLFLADLCMPALRWIRYRRRVGRARWFPTLGHFRRTHRQPPATMFELQRRQVEAENIPHLLRYEDKNSMWHSIETRLPFLDYRLVEFALNLATGVKVKDGWTKFVLRDAVRDLLPPAIVWRKNKLGFEAPDHLWLSRLHAVMLETVSKSELLKEVCSSDHGAFDAKHLPQSVLWRFHVVALWEREFGITGAADLFTLSGH